MIVGQVRWRTPRNAVLVPAKKTHSELDYIDDYKIPMVLLDNANQCFELPT
jgi:hypothetical protein